ncbi:hypothetical protein PEC18_23525 [Paucibacter sp. O1-1]|nr:hypothetical protein [Paucibacter sp. O1-1]MDA3828715.1 hypothetical protein [Paucibacter sp. O1-1]
MADAIIDQQDGLVGTQLGGQGLTLGKADVLERLAVTGLALAAIDRRYPGLLLGHEDLDLLAQQGLVDAHGLSHGWRGAAEACRCHRRPQRARSALPRRKG